MKSRSIKIALLSAVAVANPFFLAAGTKPVKASVPETGRPENTAVVTRALQQGKGSGLTRAQGIQANAWREQTPADSAALNGPSAPAHPNYSDSAFRK